MYHQLIGFFRNVFHVSLPVIGPCAVLFLMILVGLSPMTARSEEPKKISVAPVVEAFEVSNYFQVLTELKKLLSLDPNPFVLVQYASEEDRKSLANVLHRAEISFEMMGDYEGAIRMNGLVSNLLETIPDTPTWVQVLKAELSIQKAWLYFRAGRPQGDVALAVKAVIAERQVAVNEGWDEKLDLLLVASGLKQLSTEGGDIDLRNCRETVLSHKAAVSCLLDRMFFWGMRDDEAGVLRGFSSAVEYLEVNELIAFGDLAWAFYFLNYYAPTMAAQVDVDRLVQRYANDPQFAQSAVHGAMIIRFCEPNRSARSRHALKKHLHILEDAQMLVSSGRLTLGREAAALLIAN